MNTLDQHAHLFKALARPERLRVLLLLQDGERSVLDLLDALDAIDSPIDQSTLSQHLAVLRREGLVDYRKQGLRHRYYICPDAHRMLQALVGRYTAAKAGVL